MNTRPRAEARPDPLDAIAVRRHLHRRPEIGFLEIETADLAWNILSDLGWRLRGGGDLVDVHDHPGLPSRDELDAAAQRATTQGVPESSVQRFSDGNTAFVAELRGARPGPLIALRVDMDALPIQESRHRGHDPAAQGFDSTIDGAMHACGHDGHVAIALRAAALLSDRRFAGIVRLLFQPAEEGVRGAAPMVAAGLVDDVDVLLAVHLGFGTPDGCVAAATELYGTSKLRAEFTGVAAHASGAPEQGRSALVAAASAVLGLHALPRYATATTRVNVGALHAPGAANIVNAHAVLDAEVRADAAAEHDDLERRARAVLHGAAAMHGVTVDITRTGWATSATTDGAILARVETLAPNCGLRLLPPRPLRASDDATLFMRHVQERDGLAGYLLMGAGTYGPHHSPTFDLDEAVLTPAADLLATLIRSLEDH
ncbi:MULTISPECIES: amidohydrolase [unclassified Nonomuraea]|uniref:amidohydrolase n=1 Tax=unclassified Nonomuraea TaxID=2593643 RepID=UPI003404FD92